MRHILETAPPSWDSPQPLSPSCFNLPYKAIQLSDVQCPFCDMVVDRPVQTACRRLVCGTCIATYMQTDQQRFPCCNGEHETSPLPPIHLVMKILGSLQLQCNMYVELCDIRQHTMKVAKLQLHNQQLTRSCLGHWMLYPLT